MPPPLPPTQMGYDVSTPSPIKVELFLDLICPFSSKMWKAVREVAPKVGDKVQFVMQQVPQPWHPQGTFVHEAAVAVKEIDPAMYAEFVDAVYGAFDAGKFKDDDTLNKSRGQIYEELVALANGVGVDGQAVAAKLAIRPGSGNAGNEITQHIKWAVKYHRCRGVHVTPTVHVNGLEAGVVSSSWTSEQWLAFLEPLGADMFQGTKL
eukprot:TRINITY_DN51040_c0_g1_i1.p1 TRINITY_DN51040_c0_g1~~TRINITY_DN51040_c0_g1_i1.p1  ORF type:complete len:207 (+),score=38.54 TRINITY_DN51040_c0_g1_i1:108-728(+)